MNKERKQPHHVIIVTGLSDDVKQLERATGWWKYQGLITHVFRVGWRDGLTNILPIIDEIILLAEKLNREGDVSVLGTSAGASAAFNAFLERPDIFKNAVSVCGRLRAGNHNFRSLEKKTATSEICKQSILLIEEKAEEIPKELKSRMMTVSARFGDELVPADTSYLEGAHNIKIPTIEHMFSIGMSLTLFSKPIVSFIKENY